MPVTINASTSTGLVQSADTSGSIELQTNGTTVATVNTSNNVQFRSSISVGNATPTTSGAGITFPATQSASTDANTLDDYEQGTFTPTLTGTTQSGGTVSGRYTKIGNVVYVSVNFDNVTLASSAGAAKIANLPFTVLNSTVGSSGVLGYNNCTAAASNGGYFAGNTTTFELYNSGGATTSAFSNNSGRYLIMAGFYFTAD